MSTKAYDKWLSRVNNAETPWSEQEIIYFRKAVGASGIQDACLRETLREKFADVAYSPGYRITREHSEKGRAYLLAKSLKKDGTPRKGCRLGDFELGVLRNLEEHRLVGLERASAGEHYWPIYRAIAEDGTSFDYVGATYELVQVIRVDRRPTESPRALRLVVGGSK